MHLLKVSKKTQGKSKEADTLDDDGADEQVSDDDEARTRKQHTCGPDCKCEFLTRPKLRDQADSKQTHLMMCYMGEPIQFCRKALTMR